jgi:aminomethyltransferase
MRNTPLTQAHIDAKARMVDFHGWNMPVQYAGILEEAERVRTKVGLFDLCHMGRLEITGPDREALVNRVFSGRTAKLDHGRAKYGFLLNEAGYPIDDVLIYRDVDIMHIVINATGRDTDPAWVRTWNEKGGFDATVKDVSDDQAMIALQGPASEMTLQPLCGADLSALRYYGFLTAPVSGVDCLIARTGYTGEDGFELFFPPAHAPALWSDLLGSGRSLGIGPIGLGARDTLRLEAGMPLYGQEINLEIHPLEADLAFGLGLKRLDTVGIPALVKIREEGFPRRAVSLSAPSGRVARPGCKVFRGGAEVGFVTSGTRSPTLGTNIARALVQAEAAESGAVLDVEIRGKPHPFEVVPSPFYSRKR